MRSQRENEQEKIDYLADIFAGDISQQYANYSLNLMRHESYDDKIELTGETERNPFISCVHICVV
jgi:hypothetical protein